MARKQETTVQYTNGSETIVKTNYHHGMHINHSMQVIQLLSHVWSQSYSSLFSPSVLVVLVYNTLSWLLPATVLHKDVDTWSSHPKITYPYSSSRSCSWTTHRDSRCWQPSLLQSRWCAILCEDFKGRWNGVVCWGDERKKNHSFCQITDKAHKFGEGLLFDKILPFLSLMEHTLEDQECHLLLKVCFTSWTTLCVHMSTRSLLTLNHCSLMKTTMLKSKIVKSSWIFWTLWDLPTWSWPCNLISIMLTNVREIQQLVPFSVVASALGIPSLLPFLKAVCRLKKSWQTRHGYLNCTTNCYYDGLRISAAYPPSRWDLIRNLLSWEGNRIFCQCTVPDS